MHYFFNGLILTQHDQYPVAESLLIDEGRVAAVDSDPPPGAVLVDLQGKTIVPGFNDAHIHVWKVGDLLTNMLDLRGVKSVAEMQERLAAFANAHPYHPWILARGFNEAQFPDGRMPDRFDLDEVVPDRPCQIIRTCAHIAILNSKALETCGINAATAIPPGGEIRRNTDGVLTGVITETALGLTRAHIPAYTAADYKRMILAAQEALLEAGITSATDPAVMPDLLEVYRAMEADEELKIRINAFPIRVPDGATAALPLPELYHSPFLTVNTVKFFADGGISGKTAATKLPYKNTNEHGVLRLEYDFFKQLALESQAAGFRIATHAIGDKAIDLVLRVYEDIQPANRSRLRHRIEHLGLPDAGHLQKMKDLGVFCVSQPIFIRELGRNFRNYLPDTYLHHIYPYRTILDAGVALAFSSDAPVVRDYRPLTGIENAMERQDDQGIVIGPDEAITAAEALAAYTRDAALANDDDTMGVLAAGKRADFVILDGNPLEDKGVEVAETWVGGKRWFKK